MARLPRLSLSRIPQHVVQRGNNRLPVFFFSDDYYLYLEFLQEASEKYDVMVHAYCLMPNHVHLLMTPDTKNGISRVLQDLGRRYVRYVNYRHKRTGSLWEGRYHSCLVESEKYLLDCYRYIESNPVRTGITRVPQDYVWSSFHHNAVGNADNNLVPHGEYLKLGLTTQERCQTYRVLFENQLESDVVRKIREATQSNRVLGSEAFIYEIETLLSINVHKKKPGRPKKIYAYGEQKAAV